VDVRLSNDSTLCLALLEAPEMATEVLAQAKQNRQWPQAARFSDWLAQNRIQSQRELTRALATQKDARDRFFNLFDGLEHIPARDRTLAAARELLSPNEEAARQQRVATLLRNLATLSPEQREELRTLSAGTLNPKDDG
jgi:DNA primase